MREAFNRENDAGSREPYRMFFKNFICFLLSELESCVVSIENFKKKKETEWTRYTLFLVYIDMRLTIEV